MAAKSADSHTIQEIRRLAVDPSRVRVTRGTEWDLLAHHLTKEDVCDKIIDWIDADERVKPTTIHSDRFPSLKGQEAYEMKPRIQGTLFYIKVALVELGQPDEYMLVISAHPNH
ncbi:MAG: hypothetical protein HQ581_13455 [Planctomycetes bacterium]|nr:hypothetical protein [Planctomycetota bacterium]